MSDDKTETVFYNSAYVILYIITCNCVRWIEQCANHLKGRIQVSNMEVIVMNDQFGIINQVKQAKVHFSNG